MKNKTGKNIYCDGGAKIVNMLMKDDLIDEFAISIIPIFLGSGIQLFKQGRPSLDLTLVSATSFKKGLVQVKYVRK